MNPVAAALIIVALLVVATVVGLVWRARTGRVQTVRGAAVGTKADETGAAGANTLGPTLTATGANAEPAAEFSDAPRAQDRPASAVESVRASDLGLDETVTDAFGARATLLQFSTEFCTYCPQTRVLLGKLADARDGVTHLDIDLTHAPEIANRFRVRQTPTTLLLDENKTIRARVGGPPRAASLIEHLDQILGEHHVTA